MSKYSILMVILNDRECRYFKEFSCLSYLKFLDGREIDKFYVVCGERFVDELKCMTDNRDICFDVIDYDKLVRNANIVVSNPSEILKVSIASVVKTKYYMYLCNGLFLTRRFVFGDMFYEGKIKTDKFDSDVRGPSFYPEILITRCVKDILDNIGMEFYDRFELVCNMYWDVVKRTDYKFMYSHGGGVPLFKDENRLHNVYYDDLRVGNILNAWEDEECVFSVFNPGLNVNPVCYIMRIQNLLSKS